MEKSINRRDESPETDLRIWTLDLFQKVAPQSHRSFSIHGEGKIRNL